MVPLGVRPPAAAPEETRAPLILFVGSLFQRRRVDVLIDAFRSVAAAHPAARLEIVGANRTRPFVDFAAQVTAAGLASRVTLRDWVDDETLQALYAQASVFVFLSRYEGFGFTPLEAMAHGAVPVVLDTPVAREIYGDAAWRVSESRDLTSDVARAMTQLLTGGAERERLRQAAGPVLARYQWPGNIRELENVIECAVISASGALLQIPTLDAGPADQPGALTSLADVERAHIIAALEQTLWRIEGTAGAASILGLHPDTLRYRMKKYKIIRPRPPQS